MATLLKSVLSKNWLTQTAKSSKASAKSPLGRVVIFGAHLDKPYRSYFEKDVMPWQYEQLNQKDQALSYVHSKQGPAWIVRLKHATPDMLQASPYALVRNLCGQLVKQLESTTVETLHIDFVGCDDDVILGTLVGLEVAAYRFQQHYPKLQKNVLPALKIFREESQLNKALIKKALHIAQAINIGRHLVNLPAQTLNPDSYSRTIKQLFHTSPSMHATIWPGKKLEREGMGLLSAVGQGASHEPCMVHLRYRPRTSSSMKPLAFVGKGITFDSGGLSMKPSQYMRYMKKDMGGSASLVGLAYWLSQSKLPIACDFYLAIAENSVDAKSVRPGDILTARNGTTVEIHNTDAEGRLALADAMDVAVSQTGKHKPQLLIDLATLTGAIKAGLGNELAGLFSTHDGMAEQLLQASQNMGDACWRMPLVESYEKILHSDVADVVNAADSPGGAITAALFLQKFVGDIPWAHIDMFAWKDKAKDCYSESGGSGQMVQSLIYFLENFKSIK